MCSRGRVRDALFAWRMLTFVHPRVMLKTIAVCQDDSGAVHLANKSMRSARSKHIDIRHHFIRDIVKRGEIKIVHVRTEFQHADLLTKNLNGDAYRQDREGVMILTVGIKKQGGCSRLMTLVWSFLVQWRMFSGIDSCFESPLSHLHRGVMDSLLFFSMSRPCQLTPHRAT